MSRLAALMAMVEALIDARSALADDALAGMGLGDVDDLAAVLRRLGTVPTRHA